MFWYMNLKLILNAQVRINCLKSVIAINLLEGRFKGEASGICTPKC